MIIDFKTGTDAEIFVIINKISRQLDSHDDVGIRKDTNIKRMVTTKYSSRQ